MIGFRLFLAVTWLGLAVVRPGAALAQLGDNKGEIQIPRVPKEKIPPAPPLSPDAALKQFQIAAGFRIELVASEPLVENPILLQFDADGRLWVVEMRSYMPTPDGLGETNAISQISILEDTDHDGRMDRKKVFLDHLVLPRALLLINGGALVCEPPQLWFYPNHNDTAGPRVLVAADFAKEADPALGPRMNLEHSGCSLLLNMDNWIYCLHHTYRYRWGQGRWQREPTTQRVQWGLAHDDFGRLFYTSNSEQLRGDLVASHYFAGRPPKQRFPGLSVQIARDQTTWPARMNPGVNRGYEPNVLRPDGTLQKFTAACGTALYRGDLFPAEFYGNVFTCEPAANLIRRNILSEHDAVITARNPYENEHTEFLASRDELFRPVNLVAGPDGALYIADMYHGLIQHRAYVTSYLRAQAEDRGLEKVIHQGRIWRIVPQSASASLSPTHLGEANLPTLVNHLTHANGWWRDTAQRLLIERGDPAVVPALRKLAASEAGPASRLHALWTLEGLGQLQLDILEPALNDPVPKVRAGAVRLGERFLTGPDSGSAAPKLLERILQLAADSSSDVQVQVALTLGLLPVQPQTKAALEQLARNGTSPLARDVAAFSLGLTQPEVKAAGASPVAQARPLTDEEKLRFDAGKQMFEATCLACHQVHGLGQPGLAPPLVDSEWVKGSDDRLIRIVLNGLRGPIKVKGDTFELDMPSLGVLDDDQIAAVLTYVRREWGHTFEPVTPAKVKKVRDETASREDAWTMPDLLKVP
jgi:mono/diheme cytochrome c family protein/glucose/arabinose dehydrogenase